MAIYLRKFNTKSAADEYRNSEAYVEPFVGGVAEDNESLYNKQYLAGITIDKLKLSVGDVPASGGTVTYSDCTYVITAHYGGSAIKEDVTELAEMSGTLVVEASFNEQRHSAGTLTVTATYSGFSATSEVKVYQAAYVPKPTGVSFADLQWVVDVSYSGGVADKSNCTYSVVVNYDNGVTCAVTRYAVVSGSLSVEPTMIMERHSAGTLTLSASYSGFSKNEDVVTYQEAFSYRYKMLTFNILSGGTISYGLGNNWYYGDSGKTVEYKVNDGQWNSFTPYGDGETLRVEIPVESGDVVQFKGDNKTYHGNCFSSDGALFTIEGNIMSLVNSTGYVEEYRIKNSSAFSWLFGNCTGLTSAENFVLPATTLTSECYYAMFSNCTSLTAAPELPATTLAENCYDNMFWGCTSLTTAPSLPATTLTDSCYSYMFDSCTSLTQAPSLPATTLTQSCYVRMFYGCTSLTTAPALSATILADYCYSNMFQGCTSLTTAPELPATTLAESCYNMMFEGCTSLTTVPALSATTLADSCYQYMFAGCTSLTTVPSDYLPATTLATWCYSNMFADCTSLTIAPELPSTTLVEGCYNYMFGGCESLNYIKCLATDISATYCIRNWVYGVASTGTFVKNPSMSDFEVNSPDGIPENWACGSESDTLLASSQLLAKQTGGNFAGSVYSKTGSWTASTNDSWINIVNPTGGTGLTTLNISISSSNVGRTGQISVTDGQTTKLINVTENDAAFPLTFKIISGGTIYWKKNSSSAPSKTIEYRINNGFNNYWQSLTSSEGQSSSIYVRDGDTVIFRGNNQTYGDSNNSYYSCFSGSTDVKFEVEGNIMSLIDSTGFATATTLASSYTFSNLFRNCTGLTSVENLVLPATALANSCYYYMFQGCTSLTAAPSLPATTLANYCYSYMFNGCTSLTTAPELHATALTEGCYNSMFQSCTSLTQAPSLPATTLANNCYDSMFYGCTSLTTSPSLPATTLANYCYKHMFFGCTSLTTAPSLPATTLASSCYNSMFYGCTRLATAPELPATTLANYCYYNMFRGCTSLRTAPELPATILNQYCYYLMFQGCTSLNYIKCLATNISATNCTSNWVDSVASSGTFVKDPNMTGWTTGVNGIPRSWIIIENGDEIGTDKNILYLPESGGSGTLLLSVISGTWTASTNDSWITIGTLTGNSGFTTVTITTQGSQSIRNGEVTFTNGNSTSVVTISQNDVETLRHMPLTFKIISGGTINWVAYDSYTQKTIQYKKNNGGWINITSTTRGGTSISVSTGDIIQFRGDNTTYATSTSRYNYFNNQGEVKFEAEGNIMSLIDSINFAEVTTLATSYTFYYLFQNCTGLVSAKNLMIPATTLKSYCYDGMFARCTSLKKAPSILPATTLASNCCEFMFSGCTSLTEAPELPATTLASYCYKHMFFGCTSLRTAPSLPATTLANWCYNSMFNGCTSLTTAPSSIGTSAMTMANSACCYMFSNCTSLATAPELPATTLADYCYNNMFRGCTSLTAAPSLPATTLASQCYQYMFQGCTGLTTAPSILPATTLADTCYQYMFQGCTSLTTAPSLPSTSLRILCYGNMFENCVSLTTAPALPATALTGGCYFAMFRGCTGLTTAPTLPATTLSEDCYMEMFSGCLSLATAPSALPATTLKNSCYENMFYNCTGLTTAPALPATTLVKRCYYNMFGSCRSLNYIKCLATDISANSCTYNWLGSVASTGTFVKNPSMSNWTTGSSGIPSGWTIQNNT